MSIKNFNVKNGLTVGTATITAASGNLAVGNANLGNLATANFFSGAGNALSNIQGANVSGAVASANNATTAGTVTTAAQPNITSVGTLTSLTVSGVSNLGPNSNVIITGGSSGQFLQTNGSGNLSWVTVGTSGISNGTSSVSVPVSNGNILANVNGNTVLTVAELGANITGYANITGNANVGNLGTGGLITATGNITGGNVNTAGAVVASTLTSNVTTGTAPLTVASTTKVTNLNADLLDGYSTDTAATANTIVVRNADGNITGNNISGTLSTASQPSITSVGTLSALTVTGNIQTSANLVTDLIVGRTSSVTITATGSNQNVNLTPTGTGTVNVGNFIISNLATPTASTDAATKQYVDDVAQGLNTHASCNAATQTTLATISGGTVTYDNGTDGVGATLTTTGTYTTIDGVTLSNGMRILVKNEVTQANNGIYVRTSATVLTRATDFNTAAEIAGGDFTFVTAGTLYNSTGWVQIDDVVTVGTDPIVWEQFSGAGEYTAGTGLTLTGTQFSITNTTVTAGAYGNGDSVATFTVNAQGQLTAAANVAITSNAANLTGTTLAATIINSSLTSVGTLTALAVTGNVTAGNVYANSGTIGASLLTGTLTTAAQPNITSVGTLTSLTVTGTATAGNLSTGGTLSVTGNANVGNIGGAAGVFTANVSAGNLSTGGVLSVTGNANVGNLGTGGLITATGNVSGGNLTTGGVVAATGNVSGGNLTTGGALTVTGNANVGNLSTAGTVVATGNISANYFIGNGSQLTGIDATAIQNGSANVRTFANANVTISAAGNANVVTVTGSTVEIVGNVSASNANLGNAVTANFFIGSGNNLSNIQGANVTGAVATATTAGTVTTAAQPNITSVGTLTSLAVTGNASANNFTGANLVSANFVTGTLTTAAQPNITSVGSLTSLDVTGNVTAEYIKPVGYSTDRANVVVTANTVIDQFNPATFRTAKYVISASGDDGYQSVETLLVHDGVDAYITIYGSVCSNVSADIIDVSANINGVSGNVAVYATTASGNVLVNVVASYIKT
jgi:hypothetical protein